MTSSADPYAVNCSADRRICAGVCAIRSFHVALGVQSDGTGQTEAIQRGAQLRIAEQKLRSGDVRGTRLLLEHMEIDFPEQKLEGIFRFLMRWLVA